MCEVPFNVSFKCYYKRQNKMTNLVQKFTYSQFLISCRSPSIVLSDNWILTSSHLLQYVYIQYSMFFLNSNSKMQSEYNVLSTLQSNSVCISNKGSAFTQYNISFQCFHSNEKLSALLSKKQQQHSL